MVFKHPSPESISSFKKNGWYVSDFSLPQSLINSARKAALEFYEGQVDHTLPSVKNIANDSDFSAASIRNNEFTVLQKKWAKGVGIASLCLHHGCRIIRIIYTPFIF